MARTTKTTTTSHPEGTHQLKIKGRYLRTNQLETKIKEKQGLDVEENHNILNSGKGSKLWPSKTQCRIIIMHQLDIWEDTTLSSKNLEPVFFFTTSGFGIQQNWIQKKADEILFLSSHPSVFLSHLSAAVHPHRHILCALLENVKKKYLLKCN